MAARSSETRTGVDALDGLRRYIATRLNILCAASSSFWTSSILPDNMLVNIALDDAYFGGRALQPHPRDLGAGIRWATGCG